jgi:hypothetical protein
MILFIKSHGYPFMINLRYNLSKIFSSLSFPESRFDSRKVLALMLVVIVTVMLDSEIGYVADFIPRQISSAWGIVVFTSIAIIFAVTQYFIVSNVHQSNKEHRARALYLNVTHNIVSVSQFILAGILALVILQILMAHQYSIVALYASHAISYGLWIITLGFLARAFFSWYKRSDKNAMVLILTLSMIAYAVNGAIGLSTYLDILAQQKQVISSTDVAHFPDFTIASIGGQIATANIAASGAAYVLTWIGTVKLLHPFIQRLGKIKFWTIMGATMVYYLVSFPLFVLGYYTPSDDTNAMTNILIFSLGGISTGIVFGAAFLSVARTLPKGTALRNHITIAAYGFLLFYVAGSAMAAQAAFPPFGLVSLSFTGLSCYLIYSGLYSSAVTVSQDRELRQSIRKSVNEQSKLLDSIGTAHLEQELQSIVLAITKKYSDSMVEETGVEASMTEGDIKEYIQRVRDEVQRS